MHNALLKLGLEQQQSLLDVAEQLQRVRVGRVLAQDGTRLEHHLVGRKVGTLEEDKLVLVREVERALRVLGQAEVQRLDARGGGVGPVVGRREQLGAPEARLHVGVRRRKDGRVVDGQGQWHRLLVKLFVLISKSKIQLSANEPYQSRRIRQFQQLAELQSCAPLN